MDTQFITFIVTKPKHVHVGRAHLLATTLMCLNDVVISYNRRTLTSMRRPVMATSV